LTTFQAGKGSQTVEYIEIIGMNARQYKPGNACFLYLFMHLMQEICLWMDGIKNFFTFF